MVGSSMNKKEKNTHEMAYYEFESRYLPEKYKKRIEEAEKKREDYLQMLGKKIVDEVRKDFCL